MRPSQSLVAGQPAEAELAQFFEQSFDLHCVAGLDGYFTRLNPAWVAALGWTLEELRARPFVAFVHVDEDDEGPDPRGAAGPALHRLRPRG